MGLLLLGACGQDKGPAGQRNDAASLPASFNFNQLGLKVLTSSINRQQGTMAILYGNDPARQAARARAGTAQPGEVLALLTWEQQDDPNWFGARIPGALHSLELLRVGSGPTGHPAVTYQFFVGKNLRVQSDTSRQRERVAFLLAQKPAVLP